MTYTITQDQRDWLQALIDLMTGPNKHSLQTWLDGHTAVTSAELSSAAVYVTNTPYYDQFDDWSNWVKGGSRPGQPH